MSVCTDQLSKAGKFTVLKLILSYSYFVIEANHEQFDAP